MDVFVIQFSRSIRTGGVIGGTATLQEAVILWPP
jgi:hypothetical protein